MGSVALTYLYTCHFLQIEAADLRDHLSTCVGPDAGRLNEMMMKILGGHLVEFCSGERNTLVNEVAPRLQAQGFDAKIGWNCSYPGKWPVTANPVLWAEKISAENRQAWIGEPLQVC